MSARFPLPDVDWEPVREFWAGAAREALVIPRCQECRLYVWYPKPACPQCGSADIGWEEVSGRGTLFSWAVVERALFEPFADKVPYVTGLVALEEDPCVRLVTGIVDCAAEDLRMDLPVSVVFRPLELGGGGGEDTQATRAGGPERGEAGRVVAPFFAPRE